MMKIYCRAVFLLCVCLISPVSASEIGDAVLKVFVTSNQIDFYRPWQSQGSTSATGSAVVLKGNKILTNAHVIADNTFIQLRKGSNPKKYSARVLAFGNDCDLALLTVDDHDFFKGIIGLEIGELPNLKETVTVIGYPEGGDKVSITEGVVSRIEVTGYVQSARQLLSVQIDAAINPGNSGGPVIKDGKLVGIAMQGMMQSQNIGFMIPSPVIRHFFKDLEDGKYDGFPLAGIDINNTENQTLREFYKVGDLEGGILISKVMPGSSAEGRLKEGDVVLALDGIPIGVDGTFKFRNEERLILSHVINEKQIGDTINIKYVRNGRSEEIKLALSPFTPLVPPPEHFSKPPYYIYAGLVFTVLSVDLLQAWGAQWWQEAPLDFLYYLAGAGRLNEKGRREVVVLLQVLPDDVNVGYHTYQEEVISRVNGKDIKTFKDLVLLLNEKMDKYTFIETENSHKIILDNTNIDHVTQEILQRNNIPFQYSDDVAGWLK